MRQILTALIVAAGIVFVTPSFAQDSDAKSPRAKSETKPQETPSKDAPKPEKKTNSFDFDRFSEQAERDLREKRGCSYQPPPEPVS